MRSITNLFVLALIIGVLVGGYFVIHHLNGPWDPDDIVKELDRMAVEYREFHKKQHEAYRFIKEQNFSYNAEQAALKKLDKETEAFNEKIIKRAEKLQARLADAARKGKFPTKPGIHVSP